MKASDEVVHVQIHEHVKHARRAVGSDHAVLVISFHDEEVGANATMLAFDTNDELSRMPESHRLAEVVETMLRGVNNILKVAGSGNLSVVLRDKKGNDIDVTKSTFGHYAKEIGEL
jgi:hypothetical protein